MKRELTLEDIFEQVNLLVETAASKEDLEAFATKDDLKTLATKEDLKAFATKDDLKTLATKNELWKIRDEILDGMDEKLADLRGDLVILTRKEDNKLKFLIGLLAKKKVLNEDDVKTLTNMEPFAQLSL